jgi:peptidoglycan hydrolase-like protein with peptidoglycan-binding domain
LFRTGSAGPSVTTIQQALVDLGYVLPEYGADGNFGSETRNAVVAYQADNGLADDGIVGRDTIGSLDTQFADTLRVRAFADVSRHHMRVGGATCTITPRR